MNNLIDLVHSWAEKFTLKTMSLFGVSQDSVNKVSTAFVAEKTNTDDAVAKASPGGGITVAIVVKYLMIGTMVFLVLWGVSLFAKLFRK